MKRPAGYTFVGLLLVAGCPKRDAALPGQAAGEAVVAAPPPGTHHTTRLAHGAWRGDGAYGVCGRRSSDLTVAGQLTRCVVVEHVAASPRPFDWSADPSFLIDRSPVEAGPAGCRFRHDDVSGDPSSPAARATLLGLGGDGAHDLLIDAWKAPPSVDGDYFAIVTSLSPDGRFLAIVHSAVGIGDSDHIVEVAGVELRLAPPCPTE